MNSFAPVLLDQEDLSSTTQGDPDRYRRAYGAMLQKKVALSDYIESNPSIIFVSNWVDLAPFTSPFVSIFPDSQILPELETWVDTSVSFPPKKTRSVVGVIVERVPASFRTAFADELID